MVLGFKDIKERAQLQSVKKLLGFYKCPDDCSFCCEHGNIDIERGEFRQASLISPEIRDKLYTLSEKHFCSLFGIGFSGYSLDTNPCCFLENGKCQIQKDKFFVCALYPFKFYDGTPEGYISIDPCDMGKDIIYDLFAFFSSSIAVTDPSCVRENTKEIVREMTETIQTVLAYSQNWKDDPDSVRVMHLPLAILEPFCEYLEDSGDERTEYVRNRTKEYFKDCGVVKQFFEQKNKRN